MKLKDLSKKELRKYAKSLEKKLFSVEDNSSEWEDLAIHFIFEYAYLECLLKEIVNENEEESEDDEKDMSYGELKREIEDELKEAIKEVHFNMEKKSTTIAWTDGTYTSVKAQGEDVFTKEAGFITCVIKKLFGNKPFFNDIVRNMVDSARVTPVKEKQEPLSSKYGVATNLDSLRDSFNDFIIGHPVWVMTDYDETLRRYTSCVEDTVTEADDVTGFHFSNPSFYLPLEELGKTVFTCEADATKYLQKTKEMKEAMEDTITDTDASADADVIVSDPVVELKDTVEVKEALDTVKETKEKISKAKKEKETKSDK